MHVSQGDDAVPRLQGAGMTCKICRRPIATSEDEAHWLTLAPGGPLPEGWPSEDAEHLCWYAAHGEGCTPDENSDAVAVAQRLIDEGVDGAVLLVARAVVRLSAVLSAESRGCPGGPSSRRIKRGACHPFRAAHWTPWCSRATSAPS